eukprot:SAG31_NODE_8813_length_1382_cov_3.735776_1_plen_196_part_00
MPRDDDALVAALDAADNRVLNVVCALGFFSRRGNASQKRARLRSWLLGSAARRRSGWLDLFLVVASMLEEADVIDLDDLNDDELSSQDFSDLRADFDVVEDYIEHIHGIGSKFAKAPPSSLLAVETDTRRRSKIILNFILNLGRTNFRSILILVPGTRRVPASTREVRVQLCSLYMGHTPNLVLRVGYISQTQTH